MPPSFIQLHMKGHTGCSKAYDIGAYPNLVTLNSQLAEQKASAEFDACMAGAVTVCRNT